MCGVSPPSGATESMSDSTAEGRFQHDIWEGHVYTTAQRAPVPVFAANVDGRSARAASRCIRGYRIRGRGQPSCHELEGAPPIGGSAACAEAAGSVQPQVPDVVVFDDEHRLRATSTLRPPLLVARRSA